MKIIEAMKQTQDLLRKASDLRKKIGEHSADLDIQTPMYENQKQMVSGWLQAHEDIVQEVLALKTRIQMTNQVTVVDIELGGKKVTKTIAEWIYRRRDLARLDREAWAALTDRGLEKNAGTIPAPTAGGEIRDVKLRRYYDGAERDVKIDLYTSEPLLIDGRLEVVNAVTDLVE